MNNLTLVLLKLVGDGWRGLTLNAEQAQPELVFGVGEYIGPPEFRELIDLADEHECYLSFHAGKLTIRPAAGVA